MTVCFKQTIRDEARRIVCRRVEERETESFNAPLVQDFFFLLNCITRLRDPARRRGYYIYIYKWIVYSPEPVDG